MIINLYRFDQENQCVVEAPWLRKLVMREDWNKRTVREAIKDCIGNYSGPLAIEFKTMILKTPLRLAFIFGTDGPVNVRQFSDAVAEQVVDALKAKSVELYAA